MTWWCAATGAAWTWTWQPYPGVWLFIATIAAAWVLTIPRAHRRGGAAIAMPAGLALLWLALDWPLGALGAGYLVTVHTIQFLLIAMLAAPLLLLGVRPAVAARSETLPPWIHHAARPWVALLVFNGILFATHLPAVVDGLMPSQLGNVLIDVLWLVAGLALWWPVIAPPPVQRIGAPLQMLYLFVATIPPTIPAAFLTFATYPIYALYELAPRVGGITAAADQQTAGLLMKAVGDPLIWIAMAVVFFRWHAAEEREDHSTATAPPFTERTPA